MKINVKLMDEDIENGGFRGYFRKQNSQDLVTASISCREE